jgi:hypothetical protein
MLLYNPATKVLMMDSVQAKVLKASQKARKGQFSAMGHQPRLSISVENFVNLMGRGYCVTDLKSLDVWASNDFLPVGIFQTENSSAKRKRQRTITSSSRNTSKNTDSMDLLKITPIADVNFNGMHLKRKSDLETEATAKRIRRNSKTDKPSTSKARPTPPGTIDLTAGPSASNPSLVDFMEPGPSLGRRVSLDYIRENTSVDYIDLTESAAEERVFQSSVDLTKQGKPVRQTENRFLGFIDLTGGEE